MNDEVWVKCREEMDGDNRHCRGSTAAAKILMVTISLIS